MIFAFLLLSALIITEYTTQHTSIDTKQKDKVATQTVQKNTPAKIKTATIIPVKPSASVRTPAKRFEFLTLTPILFDFDRSKLRHTSKKELDKIAIFISETQGIERLFIEGNTDHIGSNGYNDQLSDRRATSVKKYLLGKGVSEALFAESGYGEMRPVDEYWTRNGKQRNRYVGLHVLVNK